MLEQEDTGRPQEDNELAGIIAQARALLETGDYAELIKMLKEILAQSDGDPEREAILCCLLNEALCEASCYDEAAATLAIYETDLPPLSEKTKGELLLRMGTTCSRSAHYTKAIMRLNEAMRIFALLGDREGITRSYFELSRLYINMSEFVIARDYLTRALNEAEMLADRRLIALILLRLGLVEHYDGNFASAKANYYRALKLIEDSREPRLRGLLQMDLASTLFLEECGSVEEIITLYESALEVFKSLDNVQWIVQCSNNLADCLLRFGKWHKAEQVLTEALTLASSARIRNCAEELALITMAELNIYRGNLNEAKRLLVAAFKVIDPTDKFVLAHARRLLGYTYEEGNPGALKAFNLSLQLAIGVNNHSEIAFTLLALAGYYCARKDYQQAHDCIKRVQEQLNNKPSPYISGFLQRMIGKLKAVDGYYSEAAQYITASISIFNTIGDRYELARSHMELAATLVGSGSPEKARAHIRQASEIFIELDARAAITRAARIEEEINEQLSQRFGISAHTEQVPDLLLLKRLGQAVITSEILLEEFAAIAFEMLPLARLMVFQRGNRANALSLVRGYSREEAQRQRAYLATLHCDDRRYIGNGVLIKLQCERYPDLYFYFESAQAPLKQQQLERVELFLEFIRVGLDKCAWRTTLTADAVSVSADPMAVKPSTLIHGFVYSSEKMHHVVEQIKRIRTSDVTVLITGESGTGKELVAHAIHAESARREGPFVAFNCTATPRETIESQLFGHRRGSFTGATSNYPGVIRTAKGGTLFLDEIGDLNLDLQPKLLRFLEAGEIQPLGEGRPLKVDVRVIAATNADLSRAVAERRYREDLYYRLNIINIHIPPLRERPEEIPMLARYYLDYFSARYDRQVTLSDSVIEVFQNYWWPGNIRQLRNEIERVFSCAPKGSAVTIADLSPDIRHSVNTTVMPVTLKAVQPPSEPARVVPMPAKRLRDAIRPLEREHIFAALERNDWNLSQTARDLGMSRRGLRLKIKRLGIDGTVKLRED